ncbi:hypothetical protein ABFS83_02G109100 [Erythranthe nasuta]
MGPIDFLRWFPIHIHSTFSLHSPNPSPLSLSLLSIFSLLRRCRDISHSAAIISGRSLHRKTAALFPSLPPPLPPKLSPPSNRRSLEMIGRSCSRVSAIVAAVTRSETTRREDVSREALASCFYFTSISAP